MSAMVYLGDEAYASAFRLAGLDARSVHPGDEADAFAAACTSAGLVLIDARTAARLPAAALEHALTAAAPLVLVLPIDGAPSGPAYDPAADARRLLGRSADVPDRPPGSRP